MAQPRTRVDAEERRRQIVAAARMEFAEISRGLIYAYFRNKEALFAHMSGAPSFEYRGPKWQLVENAVLFCLRAVGFTDEAIAKYYQPDRLRALVQQLHSRPRNSERL